MIPSDVRKIATDYITTDRSLVVHFKLLRGMFTHLQQKSAFNQDFRTSAGRYQNLALAAKGDGARISAAQEAHEPTPSLED